MNNALVMKKMKHFHKTLNSDRMRKYIQEASKNDASIFLVEYHIGYVMSKVRDRTFNYEAFKTLVDDTFNVFCKV